MRTKFSIPLILVIISGLFLSACAGAVSAQGLNQGTESSQSERTITVTGTGKIFIDPDIAYVTIGVHTENKDATQAVADNNANSQAVKDALIKLGVDEKDIQTTNFSIYPQQQYDPQGRPTGEINYVVDNSIYVTVRDIEKIGEILDAAIQAGANSIYGIQFDVADRSKFLSEARRLAVDNAQAQAEELAQAAGVTLGDVKTISTFSEPQPVPVYDRGMGGGFVVAETAASVPVSSGQMVLQTTVNMVYDIR